MDYKNTEYNELNLPISIEIDQDKKEEIIAAIKESDLKCIVASADDKTKITLSINDLEALEKLMLPFKQVEDSKIIIPRPEKKEKLLPILNGVSKLYDRSITRLNDHIITAQGRVMETNDKLHSLGQNITTLMARNAMLAGVAISFPFFAVPVNALIRRNDKKIERMQNKQIPRLEQQLQIHQNTLDRLNKRSDHLETRKSVCINLSTVISSFAILNKTERSEKYLSSMVGLNTALQKINTEKMQQLNSRITDLSSQLTSLSPIDKAKAHKQLFKLSGQLELLTEKNKMLNGANADFTKMLANINSKVHEKVDKAEAAIDKAAEETITLDNVDQVVEEVNGLSATAAGEITVKAVEPPTDSNINDIDKTAAAQEALTKVDSPKAEPWIMELVAAGKAQYTNEGFVINPENQKQFESIESHSEILNSEQSEKMIAVLSEKGIAFSAASSDENGILLTVAQKDMLALNDIMYQTIGKTAHIHNERVQKAEGNFQTVNSEYYASLPKNQKYTTSMSADKASLIQDELLKAKIPYSMVIYQGGSASMTVSSANKKAFRDIAEKFDEITALNDKDGDHIPDKIDGTYSPEAFRTQTDIPARQEEHIEDKSEISDKSNKQSKTEYRMAVVSEDEFNELKAQNFSFSKSRKKAEDGKIVIKYKATEREQFEKLIAALAVSKVALHV